MADVGWAMAHALTAKMYGEAMTTPGVAHVTTVVGYAGAYRSAPVPSPAGSNQGPAQSKDAIETRWWSLVLDRDGKAYTVRNGSCGDALTTADVPRVTAALVSLRLASSATMLALDDAPAVFPSRSPPDR